MLIFRYFDKTATDAFIVAFRLPNLLRTLLGEGALSVSFIPVFTQYLRNKSEEETSEFIGVCFTYLSLFLLFIIGIGVYFAPELTRLLAFGPGFRDVGYKYDL
ncbi:MAG: lipid II flippase MurJ, partial [Deltaproteobacteria bacterium]|nr:lipid II flippase MurJ [Deltaproteobacteria bacterium]